MADKPTLRERIHCTPISIEEKAQQKLRALQYYYTPELITSYKQHFSDEYSILVHQFPEIDFEYEGRQKNPISLREKVYRKLSEGHTGNIYDIFAKKIIIYSVDGKNDEEVLKGGAYRLKQFLTSSNYSKHFSILFKQSKDFIASPKQNGYKAIHVLRTHLPTQNIPQYYSETQIRTFRMEEQQKFGTAAHFLTYKPRKEVTIDTCPIFFEIGKNGKTYELSPQDSFRKYESDYKALLEFFDKLKQSNKTKI